eukprot:CAMPEP_0172441012 /NCGR_PEP_ID=MMETSP1065-20121228/1594_1 /TAXON_ID=265537 /ORGANISM="Amphiprora paludosa, Strain CCMP125" /LENGTH=916 /DNA_ID=CAMNT_0013190151 /DNA_START=270 /DNA_END=3020 /DNA_ORIENTATION=-
MEPPYGNYDGDLLSDEDESCGPPPPPPDHAHPDDLEDDHEPVTTSVDGDGDKFNDEYSGEFGHYHGDVESKGSKGTEDPPEEKPHDLDEQYDDGDEAMMEYDEDVDFEEDQSLEIPPTTVVKRMVMEENQDKSGQKRNMGICAALCCCFCVGILLLIIGMTTDLFKDSNSASASTDGSGASPTTPAGTPDEQPARAPVDAPTSAESDARTSEMRQYLKRFSLDQEAFDDTDSAATFAVNWLSLEDSLELDPEDPADQFRIKQRYALLAGFWFASWDDWNEQAGWADAEDECTWDGIVCELVTEEDGTEVNAVVEINLYENNLQGLTDEIGMLSYVRYLDLHGNVIQGEFPQKIVDLTNLQELYLYDNFMEGEWPQDLSGLDQLRILYASNNFFSGPINNFFDLSAIEVLILDDNDFSGDLVGIGNLQNVVRFTVGNNRIGGNIPAELATLSKVETLWLFSNALSGSIPDEVGNMPALIVFDVYNNDLSGGLPTMFLNNPMLEVLTLSDNPFGGEIPDEYGLFEIYSLSIENCGLTGAINPNLGNAESLTTLRLAENNFDTADFPQFILGMTNLVDLRLNQCNIQGDIPADIDNLGFLQTLFLHSNYFGNALPASIGNLPFLRRLNLSNQFLSGAVPAAWSDLVNMEYLNLSDNPSLTGDLPDISKMTKLEQLELQRTNFGGDLTGTNYFTTVPSLKHIDLSSTGVSGSLPNNWGLMTNLEELHLAEIGLTGGIPGSLRAVSTLRVLILTGNSLRGAIPDFFDNLFNLRILQLNRNELSGPIPDTIGSATRLQFLSVSENTRDGQFGIEGPLPDSIGELINLKEFECQENKIDGELPEGFGEFLVNLEILDISDNLFSGDIPDSIANMESLIEFFLDNNNFNSAWPTAICNIDTLNIIKPDCDIECSGSCCDKDACN